DSKTGFVKICVSHRWIKSLVIKTPKEFCVFKRKAAWFFQAACNGFKKVDAPTHIDLRFKILKDFLNVEGPMGATHFLILSKTEAAPYLRVASAPRGPNLSLQLLISLKCKEPAEHSHMFFSYDISDTKLIDIRHYSIRLQSVSASHRLRKFVRNHQVPDLRSLQDVSDFVTNLPHTTPLFSMCKQKLNWISPFPKIGVATLLCRAGCGSESEADDEAATVALGSDLGRVIRASTKSAVRLQEIGRTKADSNIMEYYIKVIDEAHTILEHSILNFPY
ncbi:hypothetical protein CUMW_126080, partial [Citrus unshiu]